MGLVGVFFVCHILRVTLNIHEMLIIEHAKKCFDVGPGFPLWSVILGKIRYSQGGSVTLIFVKLLFSGLDVGAEVLLLRLSDNKAHTAQAAA